MDARGRLDAIAQILARGLMRALANDAAPTLSAVTSAPVTSQDNDALSEPSDLVAFVSDQSVHVQRAAQDGLVP